MTVDALEGARLVLVVGLGVSGRAASDRLLREGKKVRINDVSTGDEVREAARQYAARGAEVVLGHHRPEVLEGVDLVVVSPGVRGRSTLLLEAEARGIPVWSEIELACRFARGPLIAVTGTNGKTTTVSMIERILDHAGMAAMAAGNIGHPLIAAVEEAGPGDPLVVEVSSFQLYYTRTFRPTVSVLLNIAEDHFDWHADLAEYTAAKSRIWMNQGPEDSLVCNRDDPLCLRAVQGAAAEILYFSKEDMGEAGVFLRRGTLYWRAPRRGAEGGEALPFMRAEELPLPGAHNLENAMAAVAAAAALGVSPRAAGEALRLFTGLPHRLQMVGEIGGVRFYDDSKATNPHAATRALGAFRQPLLLILGGRNKGLPFDQLARLLEERSRAGGLRMVYAIGEAAQEIAETLRGVGPSLPLRQAERLEDVFSDLPRRAKPGDVVLFSPACASFDRYRDYRERGRHFQELVEEYRRSLHG
ncbi:MAG: UDP-N-acetylmuramoyl-L-alanine--D-glutamate ligase [Actinobacteria bacterium]|nr:UDP-N-acetylmuramoyl-L-alanine--D-glutamate ligase [Actinomycetota bacterium]